MVQQTTLGVSRALGATCLDPLMTQSLSYSRERCPKVDCDLSTTTDQQTPASHQYAMGLTTIRSDMSLDRYYCK